MLTSQTCPRFANQRYLSVKGSSHVHRTGHATKVEVNIRYSPNTRTNESATCYLPMLFWDQFFNCLNYIKSDFRLMLTDQCYLYMGHRLKWCRWFTSKCLKHHTPCRNASDEELDVAFALTHLDTWYTSKGMFFSIALGWEYDAIFASNSHEVAMCYGYPHPTISHKAKSKIPCGFRVT